jgi:hypothetical protein
MNAPMYHKLATLIHEHRTWIAVHDTTGTSTLMARSGLELKPVRRRVLTLVATRAKGVYPRGHVWEIPEDKIERAVRSLKQRDKRFAARWKCGALIVDDAEYIIHHASNGFLTLNLDKDEL